MQTARSALEAARSRGLEFRVEAGAIRYVAPVGALDADLRAALAAHRSALILLLEAEGDGQTDALMHGQSGACTSACISFLGNPGPDLPVNRGHRGDEDGNWCTDAREMGHSGGIHHLDHPHPLSFTGHSQGQTACMPAGVYADASHPNGRTSASVGPKATELPVKAASSTDAPTGTRHFQPCISASVHAGRTAGAEGATRPWRVIAPTPTPDTPTRPCACAHPVHCLTRVDGDTLFVCLRCHLDPTTRTIAR